MNDEDTVAPQPIEEVLQEKPVEEAKAEEPVQEEKPQEETKVPLSALQKERKKRQELEQENSWLKEQQKKTQQPDDESLYESATKADLGKSQEEIIRIVEERKWIRDNQDKFDFVNEILPDFLKQRPNLASAISSAENRYEEAWNLINALSPKQKAQIKSTPAKKESPGSPSGVPKAASINQAVDVMQMTDSEYQTWRQGLKKRR